MSHVTINFAVRAASLREAKSSVNCWLFDRNSFFDGYEVIDKDCGTFKEKRPFVERLIAGNDHIKIADGFLERAKEETARKQYGAAGYHYTTAGELLEEELSPEMPFFNLDDYNYKPPPLDAGWFLISVDFHF